VKQGKKWSLCSTKMSSHSHFFITQSLGLSSVLPAARCLISCASAIKAHLILHCTCCLLALCSNSPLVVLGSGPLGPACFLRWERKSGRHLVPGSLPSSSGLSKARCSQPIFSRSAFTLSLLHAVFSRQSVSSVLDVISLLSVTWHYQNNCMLEGAERKWGR